MRRDPLPPVLLGEVRALGFPILLSCPVCNHSARLPLPLWTAFPATWRCSTLGTPCVHELRSARRRERASRGAAVGRAPQTDRTAPSAAVLDALMSEAE